MQDGFQAWYPYVNSHIGEYRIGYGVSKDGQSFKRLDKNILCSLDPSNNPNDFDSKAVCYPYVFNHKNNIYMLYNGNDFGRTGFGAAIWNE